MKKQFGALLLSLTVFFGGALSAEDFMPSVQSRHTMAHCHFVYQVQSELRIWSKYWSKHSLQIVFENSWSDDVDEFSTWILEPTEEGLFLLQLESMSVSEDFLYREMSFSFGLKDESGPFVQVSPTFLSDVGRNFGEDCRLHGDAEAPFYDRQVFLLEESFSE